MNSRILESFQPLHRSCIYYIFISIITIITIFKYHCNASELFDRFEKKNYVQQKWGYLAKESLKNQIDITYLQSVIPNLDIISITGYKLNKNGKLSMPNLQQVISIAQSNGVAILPLLSFKSAREGQILLRSSIAKRRAIKEIVKMVNHEDFNGIHLDFEYLTPDNVHRLANFLKELRNSLHEKKLTMAIFPQIDFPKRWAGFHDLSIIGTFLDEIVIMCYDYHRPGTIAGPVVDLKWAEQNIAHALQFLNPTQIWLGVPAYGYIWSGNSKTRVISAMRGVREARKYRTKRHSSGTLFYAYNRGGKVYHVYLADTETQKQMKRLAAYYKLRGIALWRLGFEEEDFWR